MERLFFPNLIVVEGNKGSGRLTWREQYATHTERKFIEETKGMIQPGDKVIMKGELNPCRGGCQPAIRDVLVNEKGATVSYEAKKTGMLYEWEKVADGSVKQTEKSIKGIRSFIYNLSTRRRKPCN